MTPELTRVTWSEPSRRERPMQGTFPHSVQKRYLDEKWKRWMSQKAHFITYAGWIYISVSLMNCFSAMLTKLKLCCMNWRFSKWATPSVGAPQWPWAGPDLQIWPPSDMHHSDGRFRSDWNRGLSSTGFLCGWEGGQRGLFTPYMCNTMITARIYGLKFSSIRGTNQQSSRRRCPRPGWCQWWWRPPSTSDRAWPWKSGSVPCPSSTRCHCLSEGERNVMYIHHSPKQKQAHPNGFDCSTAHFP